MDLCDYCGERPGHWDDEAGTICESCLAIRQDAARRDAEAREREEADAWMTC